MKKEKLFILDAYGFIFRAYHIQPKDMQYNDIPTGAIYGFARMLLKLIKTFQPKHFIAVFDGIKTKNFRYEIYKDYKANRPPIDEALKQQLPITREIATTLGIPIIDAEGCEADDVIASLCKTYKNKFDIHVVSSDKDLMQLIDDKVIMYDPVKEKYIKTQDVINKFGVSPLQMVDFLSLIGDKSDNIPGVKKIGPKTAATLLQEYSSLENIIKHVDDIKKGPYILADKDNALLSHKLVQLKYDINTDTLKLLNYQLPNHNSIEHMIEKYGFFSLKKYIDDVHQLYAGTEIDLHIQSVSQYNVIIIDSEKVLHSIINDLNDAGICMLNSYEGKIYFSSPNRGEIYTIEDKNLMMEFIGFINSSVTLNIAYNLKSILMICQKYNIEITARIDDIMLCYYIAFNGITPNNLISVAVEVLEKDKYINLQKTDIIYTKLIYDVYLVLRRKLVNSHNYSIYAKIDLPITHILFHMETHGIKLDIHQLADMNQKIEDRIRICEKEIFYLAGGGFNLSSPQQLGDVLFNKLNLPHGAKTKKSEHYSTSVDVLEQLDEGGYLIAKYLLEWRHLSKLRNTYTLALPKYADDRNHRIHTTFTQINTITGRLSSINPNMQNIPIRSEFHIRKAFIAAKGGVLLSADYSQIELRIFAKIANIVNMLSAFEHGEDVHAKTAAEVFKIPIKDVSANDRRQAKIINFGIIYGSGPFGLAKQLKVSIAEAKEYLTNYHAKYPEIKQYFTDTSAILSKQDYVENFFHRRCNIFTNFNSAARQRMAVNAPIQSAAADIVKLAMIDLHDLIQQGKLRAKMLLQVHDEIVFEIKANEVEHAAPLIKSAMENIPTKHMNITIPANIKFGPNWDFSQT